MTLHKVLLEVNTGARVSDTLEGWGERETRSIFPHAGDGASIIPATWFHSSFRSGGDGLQKRMLKGRDEGAKGVTTAAL